MALRGRSPAGWVKKVKEGWSGSQGRTGKLSFLVADAVFVQRKAAPLG